MLGSAQLARKYVRHFPPELSHLGLPETPDRVSVRDGMRSHARSGIIDSLIVAMLSSDQKHFNDIKLLERAEHAR